MTIQEMNAQNIILGVIAAALIVITVLIVQGHVGNISVSMPAPEVKVDVQPAEVIPEFTYTSPDNIQVTVNPKPYTSRYLDHTDVIETMVKRVAQGEPGRINWSILEYRTSYLNDGLWKCEVEFGFGLVETYYFDEETGKIQ